MENSAPTAAAQPATCPCGGPRTFEECCQPVLKGTRLAASAEELMRARFTAHVVRDELFLHRSYLATAYKPFVEDDELSEIHWTRLVIHSHEPGPDPDTAFVEFSAYYLGGDKRTEFALQERSEFRRINGQWIYARPLREGPAPYKSAQSKVGRNDPCPCGSGKKYKQCCLGKA